MSDILPDQPRPVPSPTPDPLPGPSRPHPIQWGRVLLGLAIVAGGLWAVRQSGWGAGLFERLLGVLGQLQASRDTAPLPVYGGAFLLYALVTGLALPGAAIMTLAYGWMFGFWPALVLVSFASTTGATLSFLLSRYFLRERVLHLLGNRLEAVQAAFAREGAFYLFTLRLIPLVPFFLVNLAMGLTPIAVSTYWWVSQVGMLPATAVYVYAGTTLPGLAELRNPSVTRIVSPQLLVAFTLLGLFPLAVRSILQHFRNRTQSRNGQSREHSNGAPHHNTRNTPDKYTSDKYTPD